MSLLFIVLLSVSSLTALAAASCVEPFQSCDVATDTCCDHTLPLLEDGARCVAAGDGGSACCPNGLKELNETCSRHRGCCSSYCDADTGVCAPAPTPCLLDDVPCAVNDDAGVCCAGSLCKWVRGPGQARAHACCARGKIDARSRATCASDADCCSGVCHLNRCSDAGRSGRCDPAAAIANGGFFDGALLPWQGTTSNMGDGELILRAVCPFPACDDFVDFHAPELAAHPLNAGFTPDDDDAFLRVRWDTDPAGADDQLIYQDIDVCGDYVHFFYRPQHSLVACEASRSMHVELLSVPGESVVQGAPVQLHTLTQPRLSVQLDSQWQSVSIDVSAWRGARVRLQFRWETGQCGSGLFFLDDVHMSAAAEPAVPPLPRLIGVHGSEDLLNVVDEDFAPTPLLVIDPSTGQAVETLPVEPTLGSSIFTGMTRFNNETYVISHLALIYDQPSGPDVALTSRNGTTLLEVKFPVGEFKALGGLTWLEGDLLLASIIDFALSNPYEVHIYRFPDFETPTQVVDIRTELGFRPMRASPLGGDGLRERFFMFDEKMPSGVTDNLREVRYELDVAAGRFTRLWSRILLSGAMSGASQLFPSSLAYDGRTLYLVLTDIVGSFPSQLLSISTRTDTPEVIANVTLPTSVEGLAVEACNECLIPKSPAE